MRNFKIILSIVAHILAILALILAIIFCTPIASFLSIGFEGTLVKWDIDNTYVNSNYSGWEELTLKGGVSLKLPANWILEEKDGIYTITTDTGEAWAAGTTYGLESDKFGNYRDFVATILNDPSVEITLDHDPEYRNIKAADIQKISFCGDGGEGSYHVITMVRASGVSIIFVLFTDFSKEPNNADIAEALMYSFYF